MPEREPLRSQGDFVIDVESSDQPGPYQFYSTRFGTPFQSTKSGDFVVRTGETERFRIANNGTVTGLTGLPFQQPLGIFNVKDAAYGAKGNGTTDDTAAIQGAINACAAANGGIVYLPTGNYKIISPLLISADNITLQGEGAGTPFGLSGSNAGPSVLSPTNAAAFSGSAVIHVGQSGTPTRSLQGVVLRDFSIWGGNLLSGVHGVYAEMSQGMVCRVRTDNVPGDSFHFNGFSVDGWDNDIRNNFAQNPGGDGFFFDTNAPDNRVIANTVLSGGSNGIESNAPGLMIHGNHLLNVAGNAIKATIYETKIVGNRIEDCNGGVYLSGSVGYGSFHIVGNKIWNCSKATDNTTDSVNISASTLATHGGIIEGNDFYTNEGLANGGGTGTKNRARYHINIAASLVNDVVIGSNSYLGFNNATSSYGTAAINDDGTRTQIAPILLARSAVATSHTGDTTETIIGSVTIPGGLMGKKGRLLVRTLWSIPNNADNKSMRVRLGGLSGSPFMAITLTTTLSLNAETVLWNRGAQNSQVAQNNFTFGPGSAPNATFTAAVDTSVDQVLALTAACAVSTDTITLEAYSVELVQ